VDKAVLAYVEWREECNAVWDAYARWASAPAREGHTSTSRIGRRSIAKRPRHVPQASVEFARQRLGTLSGSAALLIGAGTTSELAAKQLVKRGVAEVLVLGRDPARATRLAERHGRRVITADRLATP
jgi:glutamyl-tRNA reductase